MGICIRERDNWPANYYSSGGVLRGWQAGGVIWSPESWLAQVLRSRLGHSAGLPRSHAPPRGPTTPFWFSARLAGTQSAQLSRQITAPSHSRVITAGHAARKINTGRSAAGAIPQAPDGPRRQNSYSTWALCKKGFLLSLLVQRPLGKCVWRRVNGVWKICRLPDNSFKGVI
jgi:hypothetical protein